MIADVPYHMMELLSDKKVDLAVWQRYIADTYFVDVLKWNGQKLVLDEELYSKWMYLYRAVDSEGNTIDFYLSKTRDQKAAKRFFKKALRSFHVSKPRVITVDKNPAYPVAIQQLKQEKKIPEGIQIRQVKYLNNMVEQDHRFIKKRVRTMLGFKSFRTAKAIISGIEAMHMVKKGQLVLQDKSAQNQVKIIHKLFGIAA